MNNSDSSNSVVQSNFECSPQKVVENLSEKRANQGRVNKRQVKKGGRKKSKANNGRPNTQIKLNDKETVYRKTDVQKNKEIESQRTICSFYMQGKCSKEEKCQFSHAVSVPRKFELCKYYLLNCCSKGDRCIYMHSQFPCKFYHTGVECRAGDHCKFAHGKPLSETMKQILFKHIETPPEEFLEEFPELTLDDVLTRINSTQASFGFYNKQEFNQ